MFLAKEQVSVRLGMNMFRMEMEGDHGLRLSCVVLKQLSVKVL